MHDEPTRRTARPQGAPEVFVHDLTHAADSPSRDGAAPRVSSRHGAASPDDGYVSSADVSAVDDWYATSETQEADGGRDRRFTWRLPAALLAVGAVGFGVVSGVLMAVHDDPAPVASPRTSGTTKAPKAAMVNRVSPSAKAVSSVLFPRGATTLCLTTRGNQGTITDPNVRQASTASCPFVLKTKDTVWKHEAENPGETSYSLAVRSEYRVVMRQVGPGQRFVNAYVPLVCTPSGGITTCTGGDGAGVTIYVREKR